MRNNRNQNSSKHAYTTNGNIIQPFAFTGYQEDEVSGLKFAQARFYSAENGRFLGEDQIKGFIDSPESQNHFEYCRQNPIEYIDIDGKCPLLATAAIGAGIGAVIGGGATIVSSLVKGEKINWKNVGKNAAIGAVSGAVIGSGIGVMSAAAGALGASATMTTGIAYGGATFATGFATTEAISQVTKKQEVNMGRISNAGVKGAGIGMLAGMAFGAGAEAYMSYKAAKVGRTSIAAVASYVNSDNSDKFQKWLTKGNTDNKVYFGIDSNGAARYVGITKQQIESRLNQHIANGKPFEFLRQVYDGLTRNQARAIEQYYIENGPNELNKINSISHNHRFYVEALKWAKEYITSHCGE